jgi:hypothetical protein
MPRPRLRRRAGGFEGCNRLDAVIAAEVRHPTDDIG